MSKITAQLTPEDFGKSFDEALFSEWKTKVSEHEKASTTNLILYLVGIVAIFALGGLVGIGLFFALAITGLCIALPKWKKRMRCQRELGISNSDLREAIARRRKRIR